MSFLVIEPSQAIPLVTETGECNLALPWGLNPRP